MRSAHNGSIKGSSPFGLKWFLKLFKKAGWVGVGSALCKNIFFISNQLLAHLLPLPSTSSLPTQPKAKRGKVGHGQGMEEGRRWHLFNCGSAFLPRPPFPDLLGFPPYLRQGVSSHPPQAQVRLKMQAVQLLSLGSGRVAQLPFPMWSEGQEIY